MFALSIMKKTIVKCTSYIKGCWNSQTKAYKAERDFTVLDWNYVSSRERVAHADRV